MSAAAEMVSRSKSTESEGIFVYHFAKPKTDKMALQSVVKTQNDILAQYPGAADMVHPLLRARAAKAFIFM